MSSVGLGKAAMVGGSSVGESGGESGLFGGRGGSGVSSDSVSSSSSAGSGFSSAGGSGWGSGSGSCFTIGMVVTLGLDVLDVVRFVGSTLDPNAMGAGSSNLDALTGTSFCGWGPEADPYSSRWVMYQP